MIKDDEKKDVYQMIEKEFINLAPKEATLKMAQSVAMLGHLIQRGSRRDGAQYWAAVKKVCTEMSKSEVISL